MQDQNQNGAQSEVTERFALEDFHPRLASILTPSQKLFNKVSQNMPRVLVLGAGPSGLIAMYDLVKAQKILPIEFECYERSTEVGGDWVFTEKIGNDEFGLPILSSMYRGLRTNIPRNIMEVHPDYEWPEDAPSFPHRETVLAHIEKFVEINQLKKFIKFTMYVQRIEPKANSSSGLTVKAKNLKTGEEFVKDFDYVLECTGKHQKVYQPSNCDLKDFTGQVLHYHDLKDPARFHGKRVLIVGGGSGSMDMFVHLLGKTTVLGLSVNNEIPFFFSQLKDVIICRRIVSASGNTVKFADGATLDVDVILYATGFLQEHPLAPSINIEFDKYSHIAFPLYKGVVHPEWPSLLFVGKTRITFFQHYLQAEYAVQLITGQCKLPSKEEMLQDIAAVKARYDTAQVGESLFLKRAMLGYEVGVEIANLTGIKPPPIYCPQLLAEFVKHVNNDLINYQKYQVIVKKERNPETNAEEHSISFVKAE